MTEQERQQRIARALVRMAGLADGVLTMAQEFGKARAQLEQLAAEFEKGRYLHETDLAEPPGTPPGPGESDAA